MVPGPTRRLTFFDFRLTKRGKGRPLGPLLTACAAASAGSSKRPAMTRAASIFVGTATRKGEDICMGYAASVSDTQSGSEPGTGCG